MLVPSESCSFSLIVSNYKTFGWDGDACCPASNRRRSAGAEFDPQRKSGSCLEVQPLRFHVQTIINDGLYMKNFSE